MLSIVWVRWVGQRWEDGLNKEREDILDSHKHVHN